MKRPKLKTPDLKPPAFLADLYYDLRDRRLLPLIALVVVAIAAVPFLMGSDSESVSELPAGGAATLEATPEKVSKLTVVEATPGLRDYRKRLKDRTPTDPFTQQYSEPPGGSASSSSSEEGASSPSSFNEESATTESSTTTVEVESGGGSGGSGGSGAGGGNGSGTRLFEFVFDVQISHSEETADSGRKMSEPEVRRRVPTLTQLPGKTPVVTVAGINLHNGKVWFLVSDEVKSLDGDFACVTRTPAGLCELLEVEAGFPLELTYGANKVLYRIKVTKIDAVSAGEVGDGARSSRASFGALPATVLHHSFSK